MNTMPELLTEQNFQRLPALLSRSEFQHWTGLTDLHLDAAVKSGEVRFFKSKPNGYRKYFKWQVGRICGFQS